MFIHIQTIDQNIQLIWIIGHKKRHVRVFQTGMPFFYRLLGTAIFSFSVPAVSSTAPAAYAVLLPNVS